MIWNKFFNKKKEQDVSADVICDDIEDSSHKNPHPSPSPTTQPPLPPLEKLFRFEDENITVALSMQATDVSTSAPKGISKLFSSIKSSRDALVGNLTRNFTHQKLSLAALDDFEDILLGADLGVKTASMLRDKLEDEKFEKNTSPHDIAKFLKSEITDLLLPMAELLTLPRQKNPVIINFVGVNGTGKTTTIGKYAHHFKAAGLKVLLVAADTYRAAATEQLMAWGKRNDIEVMTAGQGADAAGLVYDSYAHAETNDFDIMLVDTAGRLQNKNNLMQELMKIIRVLQKYDVDLPHETILVLDATTGQNAMRQAEIFRDMADITGLIMTKLDGSAKGGVLVSIAHLMRLPIYAIGVGEAIEDLRAFNASDFASALTDTPSEDKKITT